MFINESNLFRVEQSVELANLIHEQIIARLHDAKVKQFEVSNIGSDQLAHIIANYAGYQCKVRTYWYFRKNVLGKFVPSEPDVVYINSNGLESRRISSIVCTLWHERIHFLDHLVTTAHFGHNGNRYYKWKEQTAPYFVDYLAEKIVAYIIGEDQTQRTDNDNVVIYTPWYKKLWNLIRYGKLNKPPIIQT